MSSIIDHTATEETGGESEESGEGGEDEVEEAVTWEGMGIERILEFLNLNEKK